MAVIPFLIAASMLAIALDVHQVRAETANITFNQVGVGSDFTEPVLTVDGTDLGLIDLPHDYNTWNVGDSHTFAYGSPLVVTANSKQYVWTSTTGLSSLQSEAITVPSGGGTITANYKTQYYLTVTNNFGSVSPVSGWFDAGSALTISATPPAAGSGEQYVWNGWTGSGTGSYTGTDNPADNAVTMNGPITETASWTHQYYLNVTSAYGSPSPVSGWFDSGSGVSASVTSPVAGGSGTQYVCIGWTGSGSVPGSGSDSSTTFTMAAPSTIVWDWKTQYQVTFDQIGVGTDFAGTVVNVDGNNYAAGDLPFNFWWDSGSSHSFSFASPLVVGGKQYVWGSTSGLSILPSDTLTVTSGGSVTGNYIVQDQVSFVQVGVGSDFTGTVVTIDSVSYTRAQLPISFSWIMGSVHSFAFQSPLIVGLNSERYVWTGTTGLSSSQSASITMTAYGSIVATYKTQYYLSITSSYDSPFPSNGWFDSGTQILESVTSPTPGPTGTQYVCTGWIGTGSIPAYGSGASVFFTINGPSSVSWNWNTQYYLTVTSSNGSPNPVSGWFDSGSSVTESIDSPISIDTGIRYSCTGWLGTGSVPSSGASISCTFTIIFPSSITWNWKTEYRLMLSTNFGTTSPSGTTWYGVGTNVTISASPPSGATGERYLLDGWRGSGTGSFTGSTASPTITVNSPINETASWTHQYMLTVNSPYGSPAPKSEWVNDGTQINATLSGSPSVGPAGTRYVCTGWSGTGSVSASGSTFSVIFTINAPSSVTWNWKTQYQLSVSSAYSSATGEGWYDSSSTTYAALAAGTVSDSPGIQHVFVDWTGDASGSDLNSSLITMNAPKTATADWKTQYYLTVASAYSTPSGSGWYDSGSKAYARLDNGTDSGTGDIRYIFIGWSGDASGTVYSQSNGITMNGAKTATANWTAALLALTVLSPYGSIGGSTSPSAGVYPKNESTPMIVTATSDVGYTFEHWVLDGQNITDNPINVSMTTDHTLLPVFQILNFTLTILPSNNGTTVPAAGTYSYNYGTNITISVSPIEAYQFDHWLLNGVNVTTNPITVSINGNQTLQPFFQPVTATPTPPPPILPPELIKDLMVFGVIAAIALAVFGIFVILARRGAWF